MTSYILAAIFAQIALTFAVGLKLLHFRITTHTKNRIPAQMAADEATWNRIYKDGANISDNFETLFEMPVIFYTLCILLVMHGSADIFDAMLAWGFVLLRVGHTVVHCTSNTIMHRFATFISSFVCVFLLALKIALHYFL